MRRNRPPTITSLVEACLRRSDDYLTPKYIKESINAEGTQVHAALHELWNYKVADYIADKNGKRTHWFALPKEMDTRIRVVKERAPEERPRKTRKKREKGGS